MKYLNEYEDKTFDMPDNFDDNYEGRKAASAQEMQVGKHMDIIYAQRCIFQVKSHVFQMAIGYDWQNER